MKIEYQKRFLKDLSKIPSKNRLKIEKFVFEELPQSETIFDTGIIEQMKGYRSYYKVRFASYRIGLRFEKDSVVLERVLHRRDIYRYFP
jgi:mRNA interferase RelE/StbE